MNNIFNILPAESGDKLKKKDQPDWIQPMQATLTKKRFSKEDWIYERKLDGERCLVFKKGKDIHLMSRNKKKKNNQYPEIVDAFKKQKHDFIADGEKYLSEACRKDWEGLIAKDSNSKYKHKRSRSWLKFKCENQQELVICGYTPPHGSRKHFGALITGFYENGKLKHSGKVGTGYDEETLKRVHEEMKPLEQENPPYDEEHPDYKNATWLKPELVGEFRFTEWTGDNKLRHPSFLSLRDDKKAKDVRKEVPKS